MNRVPANALSGGVDVPLSDGSDPYTRAAQTYPELTQEQLARISRFGHEVTAAAGTVLFDRGDRAVDFFIVLEGAIDIFGSDRTGAKEILRRHGPGEFTGELDRLSDRQALVGGQVHVASRLLRVASKDFRRLLAAEPDIGAIVLRALILRRVGLILHSQAAVLLAGPRHSADTLRLERFLNRNGYPYRYVDTEKRMDAAVARQSAIGSWGEQPVVVQPDGTALRNPTNRELADALGLTERIDPEHVHDLAIVGAGPAGLAAAVYGASEGLDTVVVEADAPGGQAGTSSRVENYLGFPTGISGHALAGRAQVQAQKFGARLAVSRRVTRLDCDGPVFRVGLEDGMHITARAVVVATGASYRRLAIDDVGRFEGTGIHYAATAMEAQLCCGEEAAVVGGGNSAGQAALYLSNFASHVHLVVRGSGLARTMSAYLIERIEASANITVHASSEVIELHGDRSLGHVTWVRGPAGATERRPVQNLFVMIGAVPNTEWLLGFVGLDARGFIETGRLPMESGVLSPYATTRDGVFAVGDVRSGSIKRVAAGVGEGAGCIAAVHQYLSTIRNGARTPAVPS